MPAKNPITDALLSLYEVHADRRQAELDLERARTREAMQARGAVPGVMAQLQEQKLKRQKQQEQVSRQAEAQGPSPESMLPPTIDVTGQTTGRDPGAALKSGIDLLQTISGGRGVKTGQVGPGQPGIGQGINPAATSRGGIGMGAIAAGMPAGAAAGAATAQQVQGQAPPPLGTTAPPSAPTPPGSIQTITQPANRGISALELLIGLGTRNGQMIYEAGRELATGQEIVGARQTPSLEEVGGAYGRDLAEIELLRQKATDPNVQTAAEGVYQQRIQEIRDRYGDEAVERSVERMSTFVLAQQRKEQDQLEKEERSAETSKELSEYRSGLRMGEQAAQLKRQRELSAFRSGLRTSEQIADEARRRATPEGQLKEREAQINLRYLESGAGSLTPQERTVLPTQVFKALEARNKPRISPATQADLEKIANDARNTQQLARQLKSVWFPEYFATGAGLYATGLKTASRLEQAGLSGVGLNDQQKAYLDSYSKMDIGLSTLKAENLRPKLGAAATPTELALYLPTIVTEGESIETAGPKLDKLIEFAGLTALRAELSASVGYNNLMEGAAQWPLSDVRKMVGAFQDAAVRQMQEDDPTLDPVEALDRVDQMIRDRYGLEPSKYTGPGVQ